MPSSTGVSDPSRRRWRIDFFVNFDFHKARLWYLRKEDEVERVDPVEASDS